MKKINVLFTLMLALTFSAFSQFSMNTVPPLNGGNGSQGSCFQLTVNSPIILDSLYQAFQAGANNPEIWYTSTDTLGAPNITTANGWTQLTTGTALTGISTGLVPTLQVIPVALNLALTPGTYRFYIGSAAGTNVIYTTWNAANQDVFTDPFITVKTGTNYGYGGAIPNPGFHPRQWNGGIRYSVLGGSNDAAVLSVDSPGVFCMGAQPVVATIANFGINQIDSVDIGWSVNGVAQPTFKYVGLIDTLNGTNPNTVQVNIGSFTFPSGLNSLVVYSSNPNGMADTTNLNDTVSVNVGPAVNGTFTIDSSMAPSATNYLSFSDLAADLNSFGICGPVVVNVAPGTYSDELLLGNITGSSATNTITINGGDKDSVTLTSPNLATNNATIRLNGTSYITIKDMTIDNSAFGSATLNWGIHFSGAADSDSVLNCRILADPAATFNAYPIGASSGAGTFFGEGDNVNNLVVMGCELDGGDESIHIEGGGGPFGAGIYLTGNKFMNNVATNMNDIGFYLEDHDSATVSGNHISNMRNISTFTGYGVQMFDGMHFSITANVFDVNYTGIYITNANSSYQQQGASEIINNMVSVDVNHGIWLTRPLNVNIWHNSVNCASTQTFDAALFIDNGFGTPIADSLDIRNNVLVATSDATAMTYELDDSTSFKNDYNVFESAGTNLLNMNFNNYVDLAAYQAAAPLYQVNSLEGDPSFAAANDLHIVGVFINDSGDASVPVTVDIDGDMRPISGGGVDPGADEFDPPTCAPPTALTVTDIGSDTAVIRWVNTQMGTSVQYSVVPAGGTPGTGITGISSDDSVGVGSLMPLTTYDYYVREICARGDSSIWVSTQFTTLCAAFSAPYYNGFETTGINANDPCWGMWNSYDPVNANVWVRNFVGVNGPYAGTQALYIYPWLGFTQGVDTMAAISPRFDDMTGGDKQVSFWTSVDDIGVELYIGTSSSPNPGSNVTWLDSVSYGAVDVYQFHITPIDTANGYNGTDEYLVFAHSLPAAGTFDYIRIDEFNYDDIPTCPQPLNLTTANVAANSFDLSWTSTGGGSSWEVEYDTVGFPAGTGTSVIATTNPYTVMGLSPSTEYEVRVREICTAGDTSVFSAITVRTSIQGPLGISCPSGGNAGIVYTEEFDVQGGWTGNFGGGAGNWNINNGGTGSFGTGPSGAHSGSNYIYYEASGGAPNAVIVSPMIDLTAATDSAELSGWIHAFGAQMGTLDINVGTSATGPFTNVFTWGGQLQTANADPFQNFGVNLTPWVGQTIYIELDYTDGTGFTGDMALDLFEISTCTSCPSPGNLTATNVVATSLDLGWTSAAGTDWEVQYGAPGFASGTGTTAITTSNPYSVTGLTAATAYEFRVREICAVGDTSLPASLIINTPIQGPVGISCTSGNPSIVYTEEFDVQGGWTGNFGGGAGNFNINNGGTGSIGTGPNMAHSGMNYIYYEASGGNANAVIVSPMIDLSTVTDSIELSFWMHAFGALMGTLDVGVGTSPTGPFTNVFSWTGQLQTANADPFQNVGVNLTPWLGQTIYIELDYTDGTGFTGDMALDLFEITSCVSCAAPSNLIDSSLTAFTVDLAWAQAGAVVDWELEYGPAGFALGTGTNVRVTSLPYAVTGLSQATMYDYHVRAVCTPGDTSLWASASFETPCAPFTAPYYNGFETGPINEIENCWTDYITPYNVGANVWVRNFVGVNGPYAGLQALYLNPQTGFTQGSDSLMAISPQFSDLNAGDKRVRFWSSADDVAVELIVGTVSAPSANATFTPLDTFSYAAADTYYEFVVNIDSANGYNRMDEYVYFAHNLDPVATFDYIRIDELNYEPIPSCIRPSNLGTANATLTSVDLTWTENNAATDWEISYGAPGFAAGAGTQVITTTNPHSLTGLTPSTPYEFYVRSICAPMDSSFWEGPFLFGTANGIPYFQDFETFGTNTGPVVTAGWSNTAGANPRWNSGAGGTPSFNTGPSVDHTFGTAAGTFMYLETSGGFQGDDDTLVSPPVLVPTGNSLLELTFWYHMFGIDMGELEVYADTNGTLIALDTIVGQQQTVQTGAWLQDSLTIAGLGGKSVILKFVGIRGNGFTSDMSIDDVRLDTIPNLTVGIETVFNNSGVMDIYPNPSTGLFNLVINTPQAESFNISIRDISGKEVHQELLNVNGRFQKQLDFTGLAKGVYFIQVQTGNESKVEKLIIH